MKHTVRVALHGAVSLLGLMAGTSGAHAAAIAGRGTWETDLVGRDLDGNSANGFEAYYDKALNVTWLADANFAKTSKITADGLLTQAQANVWTARLNIGGVTGWRLPTTVDTRCTSFNAYGGTGCGFNVDPGTSELAHLFFVTLGDKSLYAPTKVRQTDFGLTNTGPFKNVQAYSYWSSTAWSDSVTYAYDFDTHIGYQGINPTGLPLFVWAVHDGDVAAAAVPEPSAYSLAAAGLVGMALMRRRSRPI